MLLEKKFFQIIFCLLLTYFTNTLAFAQSKSNDATFEAVTYFSTPQNGIIFSGGFYPMDVTTDNNGNVYILDPGLNSMLSIDKDGNLRWQTGQEGRGPGDFNRPKSLIFHNESLLVSNMNGTRLDQFDLQGNFVKSYNTKSIFNTESVRNFINVGDMISVEKSISPEQIIVSSPVDGKIANQLYILEIKDNSLELKRKFIIDDAPDIDLGKGLATDPELTVTNSEIIAGSNTNYEIKFYNFQGKLIKTFKKEFEKITRSGFYNEGGSRSMTNFGGVSPSYKLSGDYYLSTASWPENVKDPDGFVRKPFSNRPEVIYANSVDIFDKNGKIVYSEIFDGQTHPLLGTILHVDSEGYLYCSTNSPEPQLTKIRVVINNE